jgi:beta-xylosidase
MKNRITKFTFSTFAIFVLLSSCSSNSNQENGNPNPMNGSTQDTITNPLWEDDFPDPHVLRSSNGWFAFATGNPGYYNIGVSSSLDFTVWSPVQEALPERPSWQPISQGLTWAPDVSKVQDRYLMLYVARHQSSGLQCLSRAWSNSPEGPFVDNSKEPFLCQMEIGGTIDPHLFVSSSGKRYLYFKK